jgi:2-polyprenyl-6-methoxyphenol hydroxylase-like FAD-dependent oxidoreductase
MTGRVMVVGAGPGGLASAIALRRAGYDAVVYERAPSLKRAGSGLTLWPNGLAALDLIGAGDRVRARALASPGTAMRAHTGRTLSELSGPAMDSVGGRGVAIHRAELLRALADALGTDSIRFDAECVDVRTEDGHAIAAFAGGREDRADLVVGADGIRSQVRAAAGIPARLKDAGFTVWRATIRFPLPPMPGLLSLGGPRQFGIWALPGDRVYWFAAEPAVAGSRPSRPSAEFVRWHEPIPNLLASTATRDITVTDIHDGTPLRSWSAGRTVLVGDAAHPSLPTLGQGTSQAFEDAVVLAHCLRSTAEVPEALRRYQAGRERRALAAWSQARTLARLGGWRNPVLCRLREVLIGAVPERTQLRRLGELFSLAGGGSGGN